MLKEFREFAMKGNLVDMAVGLTLGAAFGLLAASFVADIFSPPLGLFIVLRDGVKAAGPYESLAKAKEAGAVVISYGQFLNAAINFLIVAFAMFMIVKGMNTMKKKEAAAPAPPPTPTPDQKLLAEIRDLLKAR